MPNVSPTGQWTTLGPLMCILSISALREIAEDYRRQRDDDQTNNDISQKLTVRVLYVFALTRKDLKTTTVNNFV